MYLFSVHDVWISTMSALDAPGKYHRASIRPFLRRRVPNDSTLISSQSISNSNRGKDGCWEVPTSRYRSPLRLYSPSAATSSLRQSAILFFGEFPRRRTPYLALRCQSGRSDWNRPRFARPQPLQVCDMISSRTCGRSFSSIGSRCAPRSKPSFSTLKNAILSVLLASALSSSRIDVLTPE